MSATAFPIHVDDISAAWLERELRDAGVLHDAAITAIAKRQVGACSGFLSAVAHVDLRYDRADPDGPSSLIVKLQPDAGPFMQIQTELQAFSREIRFYREVAPTLPVRLARVYATPEDPPHAAILLEDLTFGRPGDQVAGIHTDQVVKAARAMGRIQARYWNNDALDALRWMPVDNHFDVDFAELWPTYCERFEHALPPGAAALGDRLSGLIPSLHERIESRPRTITHNDLRADNLFFIERNGDEEALIIDWQLATRSMGALDVARLIGGSERREERKGRHFEVLRAWFDVVSSEGARGYTWDDAVYDFRLGALATLCCPVHFTRSPPEPGTRMERLVETMALRLFSDALEIDAISALEG